MTRIEDRTPDELEAIYSFYRLASQKFQIQVWHAGELVGTYLEEHKAQHKAEHFWESYVEKRFAAVSELCVNLEVKSPTDGRWMTSNTYLRSVKVGADEDLYVLAMAE